MYLLLPQILVHSDIPIPMDSAEGQSHIVLNMNVQKVHGIVVRACVIQLMAERFTHELAVLGGHIILGLKCVVVHISKIQTYRVHQDIHIEAVMDFVGIRKPQI